MSNELRVTILGTPIVIKPSFWPGLPLWGVLGYGLSSYLAPERSQLQHLRAGVLTILVSITEIIHYIGHIISSRIAGAPVDEVRVTFLVPATVHHNDDVPPHAHRARALGGPVASILVWLGMRWLRPYTEPGSVGREAVNIAGTMHGFTGFGSLAPIPEIDGGSILKWTLVEQGSTPAEADKTIQTTNLILGSTLATAGVVQGIRKQWLAAAFCGLLAGVLLWVGMGRSLRG